MLLNVENACLNCVCKRNLKVVKSLGNNRKKRSVKFKTRAPREILNWVPAVVGRRRVARRGLPGGEEHDEINLQFWYELIFT